MEQKKFTFKNFNLDSDKMREISPQDYAKRCEHSKHHPWKCRKSFPHLSSPFSENEKVKNINLQKPETGWGKEIIFWKKSYWARKCSRILKEIMVAPKNGDPNVSNFIKNILRVYWSGWANKQWTQDLGNSQRANESESNVPNVRKFWPKWLAVRDGSDLFRHSHGRRRF